MSELEILSTKLNIPPPGRHLVQRDHLTRRLSGALSGRLTLICAPAGYGKTTLLSEWQEEARAGDMAWAWLSLEADDDEIVRFWKYVVMALRRVEPGVGQNALAILDSSRSLPLKTALGSLLNELAELSPDVVLCLDDYHAIAEDAIHSSLAFFLDHLPSHIHLVIASRTMPPLPLPLLRGRGHLLELGPDDLRFSAEETSLFLNDRMGLDLSSGQIARLSRRTEGWITGLQMAALSLEGEADASAWIAGFSGTHRHIADYLGDQVLARSSPEIRAFLLQTGILDRLCAPLADAVTGRTDSDNVLMQMEAANLFLVPLDQERRWYRYHHLFADLLRTHLAREASEQVPVLHLRAAGWYAANDFVSAAVSHALAAGRIDIAADVFEAFVRSRGTVRAWVILRDRGEDILVQPHVAEMPDEVLKERPHLCNFCALLFHSQFLDQHAEACLQMAEQWLLHSQNSGDLTHHEKQRLWADILGIRVSIAAREGDLDRILQLYPRALEHLPEEDGSGRYTVHEKVASTYLGVRGDALAAERLLQSESSLEQRRELGPGGLAALQFQRGQLRQALETCRQAHPSYRAPTAHVSLGFLSITTAAIQYEWANMDAALDSLQQAALDATGGEDRASWVYFNMVLAAIHRARRDTDKWATAIQEMVRLAPEIEASMLNGWYHVTATSVYALQAGFQLDQGDLDAATRWALPVEQSIADDLPYSHLIEHLTLVRVFLAQERIPEALALLSRLRRRAEAHGRNRHLIQILALEALAHRARDEADRALEILARALALAEPEGYVRTLVDLGSPMAELLRAASARTLQPGYVLRLLGAFADDAPVGLIVSQSSPDLPEPLRARELEVLRLAAAGFSNRAIAQQLHLTVGTVKAYLSSVYAKLGVHSRTQAAVRARELQLI